MSTTVEAENSVMTKHHGLVALLLFDSALSCVLEPTPTNGLLARVSVITYNTGKRLTRPESWASSDENMRSDVALAVLARFEHHDASLKTRLALKHAGGRFRGTCSRVEATRAKDFGPFTHLATTTYLNQ